MCVGWGMGGTHGDSVAHIRKKKKPGAPVIQLFAGHPALFNPARPDLTPTPGLTPAGGCVLASACSASKLLGCANRFRYLKKKKQKANSSVNPKCLLPSAETCSCWDLHNEQGKRGS